MSKRNYISPLRQAAEDKQPGTCQWFLLCDNPAVTTEPHPKLGDVPICRRCADKLQAMR